MIVFVKKWSSTRYLSIANGELTSASYVIDALSSGLLAYVSENKYKFPFQLVYQ